MLFISYLVVLASALSILAAPNPQTNEVHELVERQQSNIMQMLTLHNNLRATHGAKALKWDNNLASKAQQWAKGCKFQHSGGSLGPFGENLAAGTGNFNVANAFNSWASEESSYNPRNPQPSHYTQVVWKGTTAVGCFAATCPPGSIFPSNFGNTLYYVCEYSPQGNVIGQFGSNVQP
ncbi:PR-1-like protein [Schizopora paradoxa]|uniref:PR-1-like protein n=1 Tax=Schizopora paradoxa TaxID=27342 RepID=A0A0H2RIG1_9AGAM|nr:PR-1-like protein [Schizopora paradoxa]